MASHIQIGTGPLTARIEWANDAKVQATLLKFYELRGLGPMEATPAVKLNAVLAAIVAGVVRSIENDEQAQRMESLLTDIRTEYGLE